MTQKLTIAVPYRPSWTRTVLKTATYKVLALAAMLAIMYWRTHSLKASIAVGGLDLVVKTIIYVFHERAWARIDAGKQIAVDVDPAV